LKTRGVHRIIGLVLLLPLIGWVVTGFIFFVKPGYGGAYEPLRPKAYAMEGSVDLTPGDAWLEFRYTRTVLGSHLVVRDVGGWRQLDPATLRPRPLPDEHDIRLLVVDAITANPSRYGSITRVEGVEIITSTNVRITLDWDRLGFFQRGNDTDLIDTIYKIHYLQWTGNAAVDQVLGGVGLLLLALLSLLGLRLAFRR